MRFEFFPLRFEFAARESLYFPPGKAANILRGALGVIFRRIVCLPQCHESRTCEIRDSCPYAKIFEPTMHQRAACEGPSPSGLSDWPRPFVFRARHLDGRTVAAGETFWFDLHIFLLDRDVVAYFILTFTTLAREGLGPRRGKADLLRVRTIPFGGEPSQTIYELTRQMIAGDMAPASIDLTPCSTAPTRIRVDFLSPTELKHEHKIAGRPEFPILFGRIRDRISTLRSLYGPGPLEIDFQASNARAVDVRVNRTTPLIPVTMAAIAFRPAMRIRKRPAFGRAAGLFCHRNGAFRPLRAAKCTGCHQARTAPINGARRRWVLPKPCLKPTTPEILYEG